MGVGGEIRGPRQAAPDASGSQAAFPSDDGPASNAAQQMLADAMAQSFGLVEKIDFDNLKFETDDE